mgnify:CR=1 FL=1
MIDWKWLALGAAFFAGLTTVLAKAGMKEVPASWATFVRTVVILFFLGAVVTFRKEWGSGAFGPKSFTLLIFSGLTTGLSWLCFFGALKTGTASLVSTVDKLSLVFAVVLAVVFLGERLGPVQWAGVSLMTAGSLLVLWK